MLFLVAIYEENSQGYTSIGLTVEECKAIIFGTMRKAQIVWEDDEEETEELAESVSPSYILNQIIKWGWLKSDFDEKMNTYIVSFPEYSQLYVELFKKLQSEDDTRERESILSIYSALFTYHSDKEKNNDILQNAWHTSKNLSQLLSNMQDGMRTYFDELSGKKNFLGIQEVLVSEINNSDSKKYAILTTTDSFYRYKEAVKELISQILNANDTKKEELEKESKKLEPDSILKKRNEYSREYLEKAGSLVCDVEREFDLIERKYNKLIEQKAVFAKRALARIHYILQEGTNEEDSILKLLRLLDNSKNRENIIASLGEKIQLTTQYRNISDRSRYNPKEPGDYEFHPVTVEEVGTEEQNMTDYVPKPLYTKKELQEFWHKNMEHGKFVTTEHTAVSVEDLEKLLLVWQEATENHKQENKVFLGKEFKTEEGFTFSQLLIEE